MEETKEQSVEHFLDLIKRSRRGKFKIYIGMSAGVGKTFRMLQEAHALLRNGIDVKIGYIETHMRKETQDLLAGLPVIPRRDLFYKGKQLQEMDLQAILSLRPEIVIVDELAHTNIEGSKNEKRWQDVAEILDAGINVISAMNIQHMESLYEDVKSITGVEVSERVPDNVLLQADEVVNIDLTADELVTRLKEGKIYTSDKIEFALKNFFQSEKILQLRELALKEVATQVERKIQTEVLGSLQIRRERLMCSISTNNKTAKLIIRKTARLATYYNAKWFVLYIQTPKESADRIGLADQRHLINNFKLATQMGAEVVRVKSKVVATGMIKAVEDKKITTLCMGKPHLSLFGIILKTTTFNGLLKTLNKLDVDLVILS
ncbi:two-component system, OmpR family, sensor histidine kinase KdpD [Mucilaginibacter lappiensis]|uniref:Two-component system sensor histidine kinase KdpD n=1 Tax=Mucilaginibacter lappiensis TaxID=354630 RepID=A0ABR6PK58_9SPHI|nr:sensor protein KdpD [Mucilaginibacter lappiensis]MBB6109993.1 two-component system sensor histidine kinase KdpD [Mucilaginibacter lappiensis]SIR55975.1 two-component system, OmpR family, sensor histidine kinase KdpD [Mucilaginibacter lappiensis]